VLTPNEYIHKEKRQYIKLFINPNHLGKQCTKVKILTELIKNIKVNKSVAKPWKS
jgi:hypothetical protein